MRKIKKKKGFTMIEIIIVLILLGILMSVGITSYMGYVKDAKERLCSVNRATIIRMFNYEKELNKSLILNESHIVGYSCPSKGDYYIKDGTVHCTVHTDDNDENPGVPELPEGTFEIVHDDKTALNIKPTATLNELKQVIKQSGIVTIPKGTVITDETGTYVVTKDTSLTSSNISDTSTLASIKQSNSMLLFGNDYGADIYGYFYKESDFETRDANGKWVIMIDGNPYGGGFSYNELVYYKDEVYLTLKEVNNPSITPPNEQYYLKIIQ